MLIVQIVLTVIAWNRGWRWLALIPIGMALTIGLLIGVGIRLNGGTDIPGGVIILDIVAIVALILMCVISRNVEVENDKPAGNTTE